MRMALATTRGERIPQFAEMVADPPTPPYFFSGRRNRKGRDQRAKVRPMDLEGLGPVCGDELMEELRVATCRAGTIFEDPACAALLAEYAEECANPLIGKTAPQREMYEAVEDLGTAQCFAAYQGKMLAGFAFVLITALPHYGQGRKFASVESLFVSRAARASPLGSELMGLMERYCCAAGCVAISYSAPVGSRLERMLFLSSDRYMNTHRVFYRGLQ